MLYLRLGSDFLHPAILVCRTKLPPSTGAAPNAIVHIPKAGGQRALDEVGQWNTSLGSGNPSNRLQNAKGDSFRDSRTHRC